MIITTKMALIIILLSQNYNLMAESFGKVYSTTSKYDLCLKNSTNRYNYLECMNEELKYQDKILNENYKKTMKSLQEFRKSKLIITQRAWINYRDLKCTSYYHKESGLGGLEDQQSCLIQETIKRADELDKLF